MNEIDEKIREAFYIDSRDDRGTNEQKEFATEMDRKYLGSKIYAYGFFGGYKSAMQSAQKEINRSKCCGNCKSFFYDGKKHWCPINEPFPKEFICERWESI